MILHAICYGGKNRLRRDGNMQTVRTSGRALRVRAVATGPVETLGIFLL